MLLPLGLAGTEPRRSFATYAIIAACSAVAWYGARNHAWLVREFAFRSDAFDPVTWIAATFVHGDFWHLLGNMVFLLAFGR